MSFLLTCGKMYHCLNCNSITKVNYEGGALDTQIGDFSVIFQMDLYQKYGNGKLNPETQGFYLHEEGYCQKCCEKSIDINESETINKIYGYMDKISEFREVFDKRIENLQQNIFEEWLTKVDLAYCKKISPDTYRNTMENRDFEKIKKKLIKKFVNKNRPLLEQDIIKELTTKTNELLKSNSVDLSLDLSKMEDELVELIKAEIKKLTRSDFLNLDTPVEYFHQKNIYDPENLNDYICSEMTVRKPIIPKQYNTLIDGNLNFIAVLFDFIKSYNSFLNMYKINTYFYLPNTIDLKELCNFLEKGLKAPEVNLYNLNIQQKIVDKIMILVEA